MKNAHILIVDDQESIRHFIEKSMGDEGYQVSTDVNSPRNDNPRCVEPLKS